MTAVTAYRIRRAAFAAGAFAATLAAHAAGMGAAHPSWLAVAVVAVAVVAVAACMPVRPGRYRARGPLAAVTVMGACQLGAHALLIAAPLSGASAAHGDARLVTVMGLCAHVVVAVHLGLLLAFADRFLAAAVGVIERLRRGIARRPAGKTVPPLRAIGCGTLTARLRWREVRPARGPPRPTPA